MHLVLQINLPVISYQSNNPIQRDFYLLTVPLCPKFSSALT